jgi:hypothetical protein
MQKFKFNLDRKCIVWFREFHEIEAETMEEAEQIMLKLDADGQTNKTFLYQEMIDDSIVDTDDYEIMNDETNETIYSNLI